MIFAQVFFCVADSVFAGVVHQEEVGIQSIHESKHNSIITSLYDRVLQPFMFLDL